MNRLNTIVPRLAGCQKEIIREAINSKPLFPSNKLQIIGQRTVQMSSSTSDSPGDRNGDDGNNIEIEDIGLPVSDSKLFSFLALVKVDKLSDQETLIHQTHVEAIQKRQETYLDPATGYTVLTRFAHLRRGSCCGNACRHCPFRQSSVVDDKLKKKYNTAFFF